MSQSKVVNIELIKSVRLKKGISTEQMAKKMGYKGGNEYFRKENGDRKFSVEDIMKVSMILEIPIQDIFLKTKLPKR